MRLTYLLPAPGIPVQGPSGSSAHARALAAALAREHDLRLVAALKVDRRGAHGEPVAATEVGVPGWPSWLGRIRELREVWIARRIARRVIEEAHAGWIPDVVLERHSLFSDAGWRVHDRLGVPWVLEVNAPPVRERRRYETLLRPAWAERWEREVLRAAPVIAAVSRWLVTWLREEVGCREVHWVPNGTRALRGDRARGRRILGVPEGKPVIGFVGSMKPWHGVERLPTLARRVGARLALVGPNAPEVDAVRTGHLPPQALADVVAALDVGLAPYPPDTPPWFSPLKVLDYRAQGTPVVGTDVADVRVLTGEGGTVVPPGRDDELVDAVRHWLGRERPAAHLRGWDRVGRELLALAQPAGGRS